MKNKRYILAISAFLIVLTAAGGIFIHAQVYDNVEMPDIDENNVIESEDIYVIKEGSNKKITKDIIVNMMLNSIDYYDYVNSSVEVKIAGVPTNIEFEVDMKQAVSYQSVKNFEADIETYNDGQYFKEYNNNVKNYIEMSGVVTKAESATIELQDRIKIRPDGSYEYFYRPNATNASLASFSIFPQEKTFSFLGDQNLWDIAEITKYLGRECVLIKGVTSEYIHAKQNVDTFIMYVDSQTGIILKYEGYSTDGTLIDYITTTNISFTYNTTGIMKSNDMSKYDDYTKINLFARAD